MDGPRMTDRILKAMDDPRMAILGHPTGRLLLGRDPYPLDMDRIFRRAAERGGRGRDQRRPAAARPGLDARTPGS